MPLKPSHFRALGVPWCSVFREANHEWNALLYLDYLVLTGDEWKSEFNEDDFVKIMETKIPKMRDSLMQRIKAVAERLKNSEDASKFSPAWRM